jgi:hypothetical protein
MLASLKLIGKRLKYYSKSTKRLKYYANVRKDSNTIITPRTSYTILMTSLSLYPIVALFNLKPHYRPRRRSTSLSPLYP